MQHFYNIMHLLENKTSIGEKTRIGRLLLTDAYGCKGEVNTALPLTMSLDHL